MFYLCDKRRELRQKRFEPEGSEKYKEANNNIKKCTKKAKENWIEEQCSETEENPRKNNSKRAYQLLKDFIPTGERLDHCKTRESYYYLRSFSRMPHRRTRDTEPMDRILF